MQAIISTEILNSTGAVVKGKPTNMHQLDISLDSLQETRFFNERAGKLAYLKPRLVLFQG